MKNTYICLDNIRSLLNVGAIFRTCSFFGFYNVILLGYSGKDTLPTGKKILHKNLDRASLGTQKDLNILILDSSEDLRAFAKEKDLKIYCVEQSEKSQNLNSVRNIDNCIVVFGNEVEGISKDLLDNCNEVWEIENSGKHNSLNVSTTVGIVLNKLVI